MSFTGRATSCSIALAFVVALSVTACYRTAPLSTVPPPPERELVIEFTTAGAERLGGLLGSAIVFARGRAEAWTNDTVALSMLSTTNARGGEQFWRGERVAIPRETIARVRERRLDRGRTTLTILGAIAGAVLVQQVAGANKGRPPRNGPIVPPGQ